MENDLNLPDIAGDVFEIQHFSLHDGPGIRSVVFLRGCPLQCPWCHNPEGQRGDRPLILNTARCLRCGACQQVCPNGCHIVTAEGHDFLADGCVQSGLCAERCPVQALTRVGKRMTVRDVLEEVCRDQPFFAESGGGITLSGGEPTAQPRFAHALLTAAGAMGLHRAMETCGYGPRDVFLHLAGSVDLFLFDIKETDARRHLALTGVELAPILDNLRALHDRGANILVRCPIIPGVNQREDHLLALSALCHSLPRLHGIELLPYHSLGVSKAARLGRRQQQFTEPPREEMRRWEQRLSDLGAPVVVY